MFGGNETLGSREAPAVPSSNDAPWYAPLLGHKSKEALNIPLNENEQRLADDDYKEYHAFNPSLVGDDPVGEISNDGIDGEAQTAKDLTTVPGESLVGQVDDLSGANNTQKEIPNEIKESKARNLLAEQLEQNSEVDQDEEAGMTADAAKIDAAGAEAVKADPSLAQQAGGFLKEAFGDLFDPKELARMAILYAGSRALGYSHNGSLRHVGKGYLQRVDAKQSAKVAAAATKEKRAFELAKTDKFTPASVSAYRKSGDPASLVSKKSVAGAVPTGVTETRLIGGKKVSVQQVKLPNGSVGYQIPGKGVIDKAALENQ